MQAAEVCCMMRIHHHKRIYIRLN